MFNFDPMKFRTLFYLNLLLLLALLPRQLLSQTEEELLNNRLNLRSLERNNSAMMNDDYALIPPLGMLIDSAIVYSPLIRSKNIEIAIREWEVRTAKFQWADKIETFSEFRYGSVDNVFISPTGTAIDNDVSITSRYHVGARIDFTVFDVINHRHNVKIAKARVDLEEARIAEIQHLIKQEIIRLWVHITTYKEIMFIKTDHATAQQLNMEDAQRRYTTGEVEIVEYARVKQIADKAMEELQLAKKEYREALYLLGELVGRDDITDWVKPGV